jgi:hypothetical protein
MVWNINTEPAPCTKQFLCSVNAIASTTAKIKEFVFPAQQRSQIILGSGYSLCLTHHRIRLEIRAEL